MATIDLISQLRFINTREPNLPQILAEDVKNTINSITVSGRTLEVRLNDGAGGVTTLTSVLPAGGGGGGNTDGPTPPPTTPGLPLVRDRLPARPAEGAGNDLLLAADNSLTLWRWQGDIEYNDVVTYDANRSVELNHALLNPSGIYISTRNARGTFSFYSTTTSASGQGVFLRLFVHNDYLFLVNYGVVDTRSLDLIGSMATGINAGSGVLGFKAIRMPEKTVNDALSGSVSVAHNLTAKYGASNQHNSQLVANGSTDFTSDGGVVFFWGRLSSTDPSNYTGSELKNQNTFNSFMTTKYYSSPIFEYDPDTRTVERSYDIRSLITSINGIGFSEFKDSYSSNAETPYMVPLGIASLADGEKPEGSYSPLALFFYLRLGNSSLANPIKLYGMIIDMKQDSSAPTLLHAKELSSNGSENIACQGAFSDGEYIWLGDRTSKAVAIKIHNSSGGYDLTFAPERDIPFVKENAGDRFIGMASNGDVLWMIRNYNDQHQANDLIRALDYASGGWHKVTDNYVPAHERAEHVDLRADGFDGILSPADSQVQLAMETIDGLTFDKLPDTPASKEAGKFLAANTRGTALEYRDVEDAAFTALDTEPTDLSPFVNKQILRINNPSPGKWMEVEGADAAEKHIFQITWGEDANNPTSGIIVGSTFNYGFSSFGDIFGSIRTADGGADLPASSTPIMRIELEADVTALTTEGVPETFDYNLTMLIRKTDLTSAPANIYVRFYEGYPAETGQVDTIRFVKGTDNPAHIFHTYTESPGTSIDGEDLRKYAKYFALFTSSPPTNDQTSNALNLHADKELTEIDPPETGATLVTKLSGLSGAARLPASAVKDIHAGGGASLGPSNPVSFGIPVVSQQTLTVATSGVPVFYNIPAFSGAGLAGTLERSVSSGIGRITAKKAGYVNVVLEDEIQLMRSNAGTGADGEFVIVITQYGKDGTDKRSWIAEHPISDPILTAYKFPFSVSTGLTPVEVDDYFTVNFAFNINQANKYLRFDLPADNPGLDERFEFIFFPLESIVQTANIKPLYAGSALDGSKDYSILAEEVTPSAPANTAQTFTSVGSGATQYFNKSNPWAGVRRLAFYPSTYGASADDQTNRNRYRVEVPIADFEDGDAPVRLNIGSVNYSLSYYETDAGIAIYRTPVIAAAERVSATSLTKQANILFADGHYANMAPVQKNNRVISKAALRQLAGGVVGVHAVPDNPEAGTRIEPLSDITVAGGAVITAAESAGTSSAGVNISVFSLAGRTIQPMTTGQQAGIWGLYQRKN